MRKEDLTLISELRAKGFDDIANAVMAILENRETQLFDISTRIEEMANRYETLSKALDHFLSTHQEKFQEVHGAFPNEDLQGHRKYHERLLQAADAETKFWNDLKLDLAKKGTWGILIILIGLIVTGLSVKLGFAR